MLEIYMYARYKSQDDSTLCYMEGTFGHVPTLKDVFLLGRAGNKVKAKANTLRMERLQKRQVNEETNDESWSPFMQPGKMNASQDFNSQEITVCKELDADFNFPTIHSLSHWVEQIHQYGALQQYSAERHEQAH